jgi:hypothetical protein
MAYVEKLPKIYNAGDRTFYDAIIGDDFRRWIEWLRRQVVRGGVGW